LFGSPSGLLQGGLHHQQVFQSNAFPSGWIELLEWVDDSDTVVLARLNEAWETDLNATGPGRTADFTDAWDRPAFDRGIE
jgi:hypothetical protein